MSNHVLHKNPFYSSNYALWEHSCFTTTEALKVVGSMLSVMFRPGHFLPYISRLCQICSYFQLYKLVLLRIQTEVLQTGRQEPRHCAIVADYSIIKTLQVKFSEVTHSNHCFLKNQYNIKQIDT